MRRALACLVVLAALLAAACSPGPGTSAGPGAQGSIAGPASGTPGAPPGSPIDGLVIDLQAQGLTEVTGFTLRTNDGREIAFRLGILENGAQFPPGHLAAHMATAQPVRVWFREDGGSLVVYRLEDAPTH